MEQIGESDEHRYSREAFGRPGSIDSRYSNSLAPFVIVVLFNLMIATVVGNGSTVLATWGIICVSLLPGLTQYRGISGISQLFGRREDVESRPSTNLRNTEHTGIDLRRFLVESDVLTPSNHTDGLRLEEGFEIQWYVEMAELPPLSEEDEQLEPLFGREVADLSMEDDAHSVVVRIDGETYVTWESAGALRADLAAASTIDAQSDGWRDLSVPARLRALERLRDFLRRCPTCNGPITENPIRGTDRGDRERAVRLLCEDCDAQLRVQTRLGWVT